MTQIDSIVVTLSIRRKPVLYAAAGFYLLASRTGIRGFAKVADRLVKLCVHVS